MYFPATRAELLVVTQEVIRENRRLLHAVGVQKNILDAFLSAYKNDDLSTLTDLMELLIAATEEGERALEAEQQTVGIESIPQSH